MKLTTLIMRGRFPLSGQDMAVVALAVLPRTGAVEEKRTLGGLC